MDTAYNFQWNLFEFHLINSNRELYKEKHFADVTLVSEDMKKFKAHRTVLGTASTILKELFLAKPDQKITILLKGIMEQELAQVLKFVYLGEAVVDEDRIEHFEMAAKYLIIKVLGYYFPFNVQLSDFLCKHNDANIEMHYCISVSSSI